VWNWTGQLGKLGKLGANMAKKFQEVEYTVKHCKDGGTRRFSFDGGKTWGRTLGAAYRVAIKNGLKTLPK